MLAREDGGEVEDGAGGRGHGNPVADGDLVAAEVGRRWMRRRARFARPPAVGTITSVRVASVRLTSQRAAADAWLSAASGPQVRTAAIQRARGARTGWPTA